MGLPRVLMSSLVTHAPRFDSFKLFGSFFFVCLKFWTKNVQKKQEKFVQKPVTDLDYIPKMECKLSKLYEIMIEKKSDEKQWEMEKNV